MPTNLIVTRKDILATQFNRSDAALQVAGGQPGHAPTSSIPLHWLGIATATSLGALAILLFRTGLSIEINRAFVAFALVALVLLGIRHGFRRSGPRPRALWSDAAEDTLLFITISLSGAVASYGVAALTHGWVDAQMASFDAAIGFDWNYFYAITAAHPLLQIIGRITYASIFASPAILVLSFATHGQREEARRFLASFWLAAVISLILFRWLPTLGPLAYMWQGPIDYIPTSGLYQAELIPQLREGHAAAIDLGQLRGLVGPPSFHAASAMLYILAGWRTRHLRWPMTILNILMLFAIPVEGTHYAIDVISGAAVALTAHAIVTTIANGRRLNAAC